MDEQNGNGSRIELDRLRLDSFAVTSPTGRRMTPHAGQSVWVYPYGRSAADVEHMRQMYAAMGRGDAEADKAVFGALCAFVAEECPKTDALNPRTGEPLSCATAEDVGQWPNELLLHVFQRLLGVETEGEPEAVSNALADTSTATETAELPQN